MLTGDESMNNVKFLIVAMLAVACVSQTNVYGNITDDVNAAEQRIAQDIKKASAEVAAARAAIGAATVKPQAQPASPSQPDRQAESITSYNYGQE